MVYKAEQPSRKNNRRTCEYMHWDRTKRILCKCGFGGVLAIKGGKGGHVAYLCPEHAEFFLDAHDRRSEEEKEMEVINA